MINLGSIVDMTDEHTGLSMCTTLSDERIFAASGKMCSGTVILGLKLALVLQDNIPQHLIHIPLANQVSLYITTRICRYQATGFNISQGT